MQRESTEILELRTRLHRTATRRRKISRRISSTRSKASGSHAARLSSSRCDSKCSAVRRFCSVVVAHLARTDGPQVLFFKTRPPVEPVSFVHGICADAMAGTLRTRSRCVRRLSPMTLMGKATEKSLEEVSRVVLAPHFHVEGSPPQKVRRPFPFCVPSSALVVPVDAASLHATWECGG